MDRFSIRQHMKRAARLAARDLAWAGPRQFAHIFTIMERCAFDFGARRFSDLMEVVEQGVPLELVIAEQKAISIGRAHRAKFPRHYRRCVGALRYKEEPRFNVINHEQGIKRFAWRDNITGRLCFFLPGVNPNERARG